jgi:hypothetical protein
LARGPKAANPDFAVIHQGDRYLVVPPWSIIRAFEHETPPKAVVVAGGSETCLDCGEERLARFGVKPHASADHFVEDLVGSLAKGPMNDKLRHYRNPLIVQQGPRTKEKMIK